MRAHVPWIAPITRGMSARLLACVGRVTVCRRRAKAQPIQEGRENDDQRQERQTAPEIYDFLLYIYPLLSKYPKYENSAYRQRPETQYWKCCKTLSSGRKRQQRAIYMQRIRHCSKVRNCCGWQMT